MVKLRHRQEPEPQVFKRRGHVGLASWQGDIYILRGGYVYILGFRRGLPVHAQHIPHGGKRMRAHQNSAEPEHSPCRQRRQHPGVRCVGVQAAAGPYLRAKLLHAVQVRL